MNTIQYKLNSTSMKAIIRNLLVSVLILLAGGCEKDIELNLPEYRPKMVMEFYLEDNKSLNCLIQESIPFTDTTRFKLVDSALVVVSYDGVKDTLVNQFNFDFKFSKIYNYTNPKIMHLKPGIEYEVYVRDKRGREMRGRTRLNGIVPIDSVVFNYDENNKAAVGLIFNDAAVTTDYYRIVAYQDDLPVEEENVWDITFNDNLFNGEQFSFYTGYDFNAGDTITTRLYHLTDEHHLYTESVNNAQSSNGNPFGQPANIVSNLEGGIGIFSTVNFSEKTVIVR